MKINRDEQGRALSVSWEIGPLTPERDENGDWWHPGIPWDAWPEDGPCNLTSLGIEINIVQMTDEELVTLEHWGVFPDWNPVPPSGDEWFPICYQDGEDGPVAIFARVKDDERGGEA